MRERYTTGVLWRPAGVLLARALQWPYTSKWLIGLTFNPLLGVRGLDASPTKKITPASLADRGPSDMNRLLAAMENPLERRLEDNLEVLAPRPSGAGPEKSVERPRRSLAECPARSGQGSSVPPRSAG